MSVSTHVVYFRRTADLFPDGALLLTRDGVILAANRGIARLGLASEQVVGRHLRELMQTPAEKVGEYLLAATRTSEPVPGALTVAGGEGGTVSCRCSAAVVHHDPAGEETLLLLRLTPRQESPDNFAVLDEKIHELNEEIRRRGQLQKELWAQREWLKITLTSIGDAVIVTDLEERVMLVNSAAQQLTGWTNGDAEGRPLEVVFQVLNEFTRRPAENPVARALREGHVIGLANHSVLVARDGTETPIDDSAAPIRDAEGTITGAVLVFRDIAERRRAEAESNALRDQLAAELDTMTRLHEISMRFVQQGEMRGLLEGIIDAATEITGGDMGIVQFFEPRSRTLKITAQRGFAQSSLDFFDTVHEGTGTCGTAMARRERVISEDVTRDPRFQDSQILDMVLQAGIRAVQSTPLLSRSGRLVGVLSTHYRTPTTFDDRLCRLLDLLARQAADFIERMQTEEALKEADRRKDEFLAMLAHELRNPLAPIRSGLDILAMDSDGDDETLSLMQQQVEHLVRLVDDLLDVSRIMQGRIQFRREPLDLRQVVKRAVETTRSAADEHGNGLSVSLPRAPVWVHGDAVRLSQVVTNLLNNAVKYSEKDGRIWLSVEPMDREAEIRVRDEGVGIDPKFLPQMFELFSQADRSLDRSEGGLGIGLTLVKNIVEMHDGSVAVHSEGIGRGSEFLVRLPLHAPGKQASAEAAEPETRKPSTVRRILIVEDRMPTAKMLRHLLSKLDGYEITLAHDGPSGLKRFEEEQPDLVFLDIGLPGLDGYEVARRIRQRSDVLLVALTGYGQEEDRRRSRDAGMDEHLVKPPGLEDLQWVLTHPKLRRGARSPDETERQPPARPAPDRRPRPEKRTDIETTRQREQAEPFGPSLGAARTRIDELEEQIRRTNQFLGKLAHEVGNQVAPLQLLIRIMEQSGSRETGDGEVRAMLAEHVPLMNRFYRAIHRISRLARGMLEPHPKPVDVAGLVERAVERVRPQIEKRSQHLHVSLPEEPLTVTVDPEQWQEVLEHLLGNASRFTDSEGAIHLQAAPEAGAFVLRVKDNGIGISPDLLPRVFDLFVRGNGEPDFASGHLGIGLTFARQVVEAHGGTIEASSEGAGRGSEFVINLPLKK